jgi:hypothetical protein
MNEIPEEIFNPEAAELRNVIRAMKKVVFQLEAEKDTFKARALAAEAAYRKLVRW